MVEANRGIDVTEKEGTLGKAVSNEKGRAIRGSVDKGLSVDFQQPCRQITHASVNPALEWESETTGSLKFIGLPALIQRQ